MKADSSTKTTLQDLENAIKFLNKELTVKEIEDIYGDFNNPRFQAALQEAKGVIKETTSAMNLRNLVHLKAAEQAFIKILTSKIGRYKREAERMYKVSSRLKGHLDYELRLEIEAQEANLRRYATMSIEQIYNELLERNASAPSVIRNTIYQSPRYKERLWKEAEMRKSGEYLESWEWARDYQGKKASWIWRMARSRERVAAKMETEVAGVEAHVRLINKQIYFNQLGMITNIVQGMFSQVLNYINY